MYNAAVFSKGNKRAGDPEGKNILAQIFFKKLAKAQSHSSKLPSLPYSDHIYYYFFFFFLQQCNSKAETIILPNKFRSNFLVVCLVAALSEICSVNIAGQWHDWPFPQFESALGIAACKE